MLFIEIIRASILGALPVAGFTFLLLQWSIVSGRLDKFIDGKDLQAQYKKLKEQKKAAKKEAKEKAKAQTKEKTEPVTKEKKPFFYKGKGEDILHGKIMFFGGGFYGTMALLTYLIVEVYEVASFFGKIIDFSNWQFSFSIEFVIALFINSIMNIVKAFVWFKTLTDYVNVYNGFVWIIAAYLGYLGGIRFTREKGDETWQFLSTEIQNIRDKLAKK